MTSFRITVDTSRVDALLDEVEARLRNLEPVMAGTVMETLAEVAEKKFESEGGAWGQKKWDGLNPVYVRSKARQGLPTRIGEATGTLRASLTQGPGIQFAIREADATSATLGTSVPYAGYFAKRRPLFPTVFPKSKAKAIASAIENYVVTGIA